MYKIDNKGYTHILQFATENYWINNLGSFHRVRPSALNIDALEDTMVLQISRGDLISLYIQAPKFDRIFRVLLENHNVVYWNGYSKTSAQQQRNVTDLFLKFILT